jgi:adenosine deaminase
VGKTENVYQAIRGHGVICIGHCYRSVHDEDHLLQQLTTSNIHVGECPTSYVETGGWDYVSEDTKNWQEHRMTRMMQSGLSASGHQFGRLLHL